MAAFESNNWLAGLAGVTSAVTVAGNAAVLAAFAARRNLRAVRSNLFIASMGELRNSLLGENALFLSLLLA